MKRLALHFGTALLLVVSAAAEDRTEKIAEVHFFVTPDCPVANRYAPEINRLFEAYSARGVAFRLVYAEPSLSDEAVARHVEEYGLEPEFVVDRGHVLVERAGATVTPEAAVYDRDAKLIYRGRIDNLYADFGARRQRATEHNVRDVLDSLLRGEDVAFTETEAVGCLIEPLTAGGPSPETAARP